MALAAPALAQRQSAECSFSDSSFVQLLMEGFNEGRVALCRSAIAKTINVTVTDVTAPGSAIVDELYDVLRFCRDRSFGEPQTKQLLILFKTMLDLAAQNSPSTVDEVAAVQEFTRLLHSHCIRKTMTVDKITTVDDIVIEERPDPNAEVKPVKGAKKGQPVEVPKIQVEVIVQREVRTRQRMAIDPLFAATDVEAIADYFNECLFMHWRLFQLALTTTSAVETTTVDVVVEEIPLHLTPLADAVSADEHERRTEQIAVLDACRQAYDGVFEEFTDWLSGRFKDEYLVETRAAWQRDEEDRATDKASAMKDEEFEKTSRVLTNAMINSATKSQDAQALLARLEKVESAIVAKETGSPGGKKR